MEQEPLSTIHWIGIISLVIIIVGFLTALITRFVLRNRSAHAQERPIYWNLIFFAIIASIFSIIAMFMVDADDKSEIALLFLGLVGGYAASIKELDLAKINLEKKELKNRIKKNTENPDADE